jgi:hypothetical protein
MAGLYFATAWMIMTFILGLAATYHIIIGGLDFIHTVCDDLFDSMGDYK